MVGSAVINCVPSFPHHVLVSYSGAVEHLPDFCLYVLSGAMNLHDTMGIP